MAVDGLQEALEQFVVASGAYELAYAELTARHNAAVLALQKYANDSINYGGLLATWKTEKAVADGAIAIHIASGTSVSASTMAKINAAVVAKKNLDAAATIRSARRTAYNTAATSHNDYLVGAYASALAALGETETALEAFKPLSAEDSASYLQPSYAPLVNPPVEYTPAPTVAPFYFTTTLTLIP